MEVQPISVSVLLTEADYMPYIEQLRREQRSRYRNVLRFGGGALLLIGAVGLLLSERRTAAFMLAVAALGLLILLYDSVLAPILDRTAALTAFHERDSLRMSSLYTFEQDHVRVRTAFAEGTLPYTQLTACTETEGLFAFAFGREMRLLIPKRLLSETDKMGLRQLQVKRSDRKGADA